MSHSTHSTPTAPLTEFYDNIDCDPDLVRPQPGARHAASPSLLSVSWVLVCAAFVGLTRRRAA